MDKTPLKSKKFIAYLIADISWKIVLIYMLFQTKSKYDYYSFSIVLTLLIVSGFIQVGYILGQAALDKYITVLEREKKKLDDKEKM